MAITYVGGDSDGTQGALTLPGLTWPAGVLAGDCALLWWTFSTTNPPTSDPTGFLLKEAYDANSGSQRVRFYRKVCVGGETGNIAGLTLPAGTHHHANLVVYRGTHATEPVDTWNKFDETVSGTSHNCPAVTLGFANCGIAVAYSERMTAGNIGITPPTGYTERVDSLGLSQGSGGTSGAVADDGLAVVRAVGTIVTPPPFTAAVATANAVTWTVSLRPSGTVVSASGHKRAVGTTWTDTRHRYSSGASWG